MAADGGSLKIRAALYASVFGLPFLMPAVFAFAAIAFSGSGDSPGLGRWRALSLLSGAVLVGGALTSVLVQVVMGRWARPRRVRFAFSGAVGAGQQIGFCATVLLSESLASMHLSNIVALPMWAFGSFIGALLVPLAVEPIERVRSDGDS